MELHQHETAFLPLEIIQPPNVVVSKGEKMKLTTAKEDRQAANLGQRESTLLLH